MPNSQRYCDIGPLNFSLLLPLITPSVFIPISLDPDCTAAVHVIDFFLMMRARRNKHRSCSSLRRRTLPVSNYWVCSCVSFPLNVKFISELHQCLLLLLMSKVIVSLSSNSLAYGVWLPSMQILCKVMDGPMFRSRQMIVSGQPSPMRT